MVVVHDRREGCLVVVLLVVVHDRREGCLVVVLHAVQEEAGEQPGCGATSLVTCLSRRDGLQLGVAHSKQSRLPAF